MLRQASKTNKNHNKFEMKENKQIIIYCLNTFFGLELLKNVK